MKNRGTTALIALFFAGLVGLWVADSVQIPGAAERDRLKGRVLAGMINVKPDDLRKIEIVGGTDPWSSSGATAERWQMTAPIDVAADPSLVEGLAFRLKELTRKPQADTLTGDPATYRPAPRRRTIRLWGTAPTPRWPRSTWARSASIAGTSARGRAPGSRSSRRRGWRWSTCRRSAGAIASCSASRPSRSTPSRSPRPGATSSSPRARRLADRRADPGAGRRGQDRGADRQPRGAPRDQRRPVRRQRGERHLLGALRARSPSLTVTVSAARARPLAPTGPPDRQAGRGAARPPVCPDRRPERPDRGRRPGLGRADEARPEPVPEREGRRHRPQPGDPLPGRGRRPVVRGRPVGQRVVPHRALGRPGRLQGRPGVLPGARRAPDRAFICRPAPSEATSRARPAADIIRVWQAPTAGPQPRSPERTADVHPQDRQPRRRQESPVRPDRGGLVHPGLARRRAANLFKESWAFRDRLILAAPPTRSSRSASMAWASGSRSRLPRSSSACSRTTREPAGG